MIDENDIPRHQAGEVYTLLKEAAKDAPSSPVDFEEAGRKIIADYWRTARLDYFHRVCPDEFREIDWARVDQNPRMAKNADNMRRVINWPSDSQKGLVISGPTGRGKTISCYALLKRLLMDEAKNCLFITAHEWFAALQKEIHYGNDDADRWVRKMANEPLMILDDLGQEAVTASRQDWAYSHFFAFLDQRIGRRRPLIITTNMSADQIANSANRSSSAKIKGDPLVRRILDLCEPVKFTD